MKRSSYRDRDYAFGQTMLTLRSAIGLTQAGLAEYLGVSRRAVGEWEAGSSYPKVENIRQLIALGVQEKAFPAGREAEEIRALWQASRQKVLLDEGWVRGLLAGHAMALPEPVMQASGQATGAVEMVAREANVLPFQPTSFIGRGTELAEIGRRLADPSCRLLTLLGPGGVGKTRLGLEAAQQYGRDAEVAWVALASVSTTNQMVLAIGEALKLSFAGQDEPSAALVRHLRERRMLLVLDNFEHLLDGAELIHEILQNAPGVKLLVTSRVRLDLQAEWLFDVEGLAYPSEGAQANTAGLLRFSAVQLFVQRAVQVQAGFMPDEATLTSIAQICQQVAGMPLAIELAAAGVRNQTVREIEARIRSNLDALATTLRDVPARHRSMRAVFNHSWELLTAAEQSLFTQLAVFRGGCTTAAAEQVAGATAAGLDALVGKSLLRETHAGSETRYSFLEPIREFAWEQLALRDDAEPQQRWHAEYYLAHAEATMAEWDNPAADPPVERINRDVNNMRAALEWAYNSGAATLGLHLAGVLWRFWRSAGYFSEGRSWLEALLRQDGTNDDKPALRARLLAMHAAAWLASDQHDYARATALFDESVTLRKALGETEADTHLLHNAALQARAVGDYAHATRLLEDALARNRALSTGGLGQSLYELGFSLYGLALLFREQGDFERAVGLFEESIVFHREIGDREGVAQAVMGLSDVARDRGDAENARRYGEESLAIYRETGTQWALGFVLNNLATAAYAAGDYARALDYVRESVRLFREQNSDASLAEVLVTLGHVLRAQGDLSGANEALTEALRLGQVTGPQLLVATAMEAMASVVVQAGQVLLAARLLGAAEALREAMGTPVRPVDAAVAAETRRAVQGALGDTLWMTIFRDVRAFPIEAILREVPGATPAKTEPPEPAPEDVAETGAAPESPVVEVLRPVQTPAVASVAPALPAQEARTDWGDAPSVQTFYGREWEMELMTGWINEERCRVVSVLGLGGMGKSSLVVSLMHRLAPEFEVVIWRSVRDLPTCDALLDNLLQAVVPREVTATVDIWDRKMALLLEHLREHRVLIVLDNLEAVMEEGEGAGNLRSEYDGLGRFLRQSAATANQSCIVLTSREKLNELVSQEGSRSPVRTLRLTRLESSACERLIDESELRGTPSERTRLIEAYAGNPLALKIVAQTISEIFDADIGLFLEQGEVIFGSVRHLLDEQFARLSALELSVIYWLAILREVATLDEILRGLMNPVPRVRLLEAIESLHRRSLIERAPKQGRFTLQAVVMEYATTRLITEAGEEIEAGRLNRLVEYGLELASASEYVREVQERLLLTPLLTYLRDVFHPAEAVETHLLRLLGETTALADYAQGYAAANLANLLRMQRGNLRGIDLSGLALRNLHLQGVEMQDATIAGALLQDVVFTEIFDSTMALAISKDGSSWAAGSRRGDIRIWTEGGKKLYRVIHGQNEMVRPVAFSPEGLLLVTVHRNEVQVWDVSSGALRWVGRHGGLVYHAVVSPDGSRVVSGGNDAVVRIWNLRNGQTLLTIPHDTPVGVGIWHPNGNQVATGDETGTIRLWGLEGDGTAVTLRREFLGHRNQIVGLAFSPDGSRLASIGWGDSWVRLWDVESGDVIQTLTGFNDRVNRIAWSPDGRLLAIIGRDPLIWLWDFDTNQYRYTLQGHRGELWGVAFTPDSRSLWTGGDDQTLRLWDVESGRCVRVTEGYTVTMFDVAWNPDGTQLASGDSDRLVTVWDVASGTATASLEANSQIVFGVGWNSDGRWIASSGWTDTVLLANAETGEWVGSFQEPETIFNHPVWSANGREVACGTYRRGVLVWDVVANRQRWLGRDLGVQFLRIGWNDDGWRLAGGGDDGAVYVWDTRDGRLLHRLECPQQMRTSVAWSPSGGLLAAGSASDEGGTIYVWDADSGERLLTIERHPTGLVSAVAWATDDLLITGASDGRLRLWDMTNGENIGTVEAHEGAVLTLRRSPDGGLLASCGEDGAIMIWDLDSGGLVKTLRRERPYERMKMQGIRGLNEAQKVTLRQLGAID